MGKEYEVIEIIKLQYSYDTKLDDLWDEKNITMQ